MIMRTAQVVEGVRDVMEELGVEDYNTRVDQRPEAVAELQKGVSCASNRVLCYLEVAITVDKITTKVVELVCFEEHTVDAIKEAVKWRVEKALYPK